MQAGIPTLNLSQRARARTGRVRRLTSRQQPIADKVLDKIDLEII